MKHYNTFQSDAFERAKAFAAGHAGRVTGPFYGLIDNAAREVADWVDAPGFTRDNHPEIPMPAYLATHKAPCREGGEVLVVDVFAFATYSCKREGDTWKPIPELENVDIQFNKNNI